MTTTSSGDGTPEATTIAPTGSLPWTTSPTPIPGAVNPYSAKWNWGAFLLQWIWLIGHKQYLKAIVVLILMGIPLVNIVTWIWLGKKGNDLAIERKTFASDEEYVRVQNLWRNWGFGILIAGVALGVIGAIFGAMSAPHAA